MNKGILIIGACGQIGTELTLKLRDINEKDVHACVEYAAMLAREEAGELETVS